LPVRPSVCPSAAFLVSFVLFTGLIAKVYSNAKIDVTILYGWSYLCAIFQVLKSQRQRKCSALDEYVDGRNRRSIRPTSWLVGCTVSCEYVVAKQYFVHSLFLGDVGLFTAP